MLTTPPRVEKRFRGWMIKHRLELNSFEDINSSYFSSTNTFDDSQLDAFAPAPIVQGDNCPPPDEQGPLDHRLDAYRVRERLLGTRRNALVTENYDLLNEHRTAVVANKEEAYLAELRQLQKLEQTRQQRLEQQQHDDDERRHLGDDNDGEGYDLWHFLTSKHLLDNHDDSSYLGNTDISGQNSSNGQVDERVDVTPSDGEEERPQHTG